MASFEYRPREQQLVHSEKDTPLPKAHPNCFGSRDLCVGWLLTIATLAWLSLHLAAFSWDGAWFFFSTIQEGAPLAVHERYGLTSYLWLVQKLSLVLHDTRLLGIVGGLLLSLTPLLSLYFSFLLLDGRLCPLRFWTVLGVLMLPLPNQLLMISEGAAAVQLYWVVLAATCAGFPRWSWPVVFVFCGFIFTFHPVAAPLFAVGSVFCLALSFRLRERRFTYIVWTALLGLLAAGRVLQGVLRASPYEQQQLDPNFLWLSFLNMLRNVPVPYLIGIYAIASAAIAAILTNMRWFRWWRSFVLAALLVALIFGTLWAVQPEAWRMSLEYRKFVMALSVPLMFMMMLHLLALHGRLPWVSDRTIQYEPLVGFANLAVVYAVVLGAQGFVWRLYVEKFARDLSQHPERMVVTTQDLSYVRTGPLHHWSATPLSLLLQGREPQHVFALTTKEMEEKAVLFDTWGRLELVDRWFKLSPLQQAEKQVTPTGKSSD